MLIGKGGGTGVETLKADVSKFVRQGRPTSTSLRSAIPDADAQLVAENIASLSRKAYFSFRRAMKQAMGRSRCRRTGAKGIKLKWSRAVSAAPKSRASEGYHEGSIPLQTLRADIEYGFSEAKTTYGRIGCQSVDLQGRSA